MPSVVSQSLPNSAPQNWNAMPMPSSMASAMPTIDQTNQRFVSPSPMPMQRYAYPPQQTPSQDLLAQQMQQMAIQQQQQPIRGPTAAPPMTNYALNNQYTPPQPQQQFDGNAMPLQSNAMTAALDNSTQRFVSPPPMNRYAPPQAYPPPQQTQPQDLMAPQTQPLQQPFNAQTVAPQMTNYNLNNHYAPPQPQQQLDSNAASMQPNVATLSATPVMNQANQKFVPPPPMSRYAYPPQQSQDMLTQQTQMQPMQQQFRGQQPNAFGASQMPNYGLNNQYAQQQSQQRLDPDAMPSVVQVIEDDRIKFIESDNILFTTSIPAVAPPLVTSTSKCSNIISDGGSARPNFLRSTVYQVPVSEDTLKTTNIPLAIVVQPFDDSEVDGKVMVPVTNSEITRCNRCKAYMNPYTRFIDGGRRFQCALCHHISDVTPSYFANLDHTGQRLDKFNRPELYLGSYEYRATVEYCRNSTMNARRPHIIFACELTVTSKPILLQLCAHLPEIIKTYLPRDPLNPGSPPPMIGFVTYNSKIQIYDIVNDGHAHIICDVSSTFPPFTTFLADPLIHSEQINSFFARLPTLYSDDELETQTVLGPVIEAAFLSSQVDINNWIANIQNNENGTQNDNKNESIPVGKIYLFHCTLPTYGTEAETPGRLKPRWTTSPDEVRKLLGTDKEKTILAPDTNKYYNGLGQRCVTEYGSGVELFLFPPINGSYLDIATLGELTRLTGTGAIYKYFNDFSDRFLIDLKFSLRSSFAFDAIMKVRTSTGIRAHEYTGNYYARTTSDIECATINTNSNIAVELKYDDKIPEDEFMVIQVAVLYTSLCGERRVRVHNIALSPCQSVADVYRNACCDTTINVLVRQFVSALRMGEKTVQQSKELLILRIINILAAYRKHCAQPGSSLGQLILPEALKLLPMYLCGALKCDAIDGGSEMTPDDKAYAQIKLIGAPLLLSQVILYPQLLRIEYDEQSDESAINYVQIRCTSHKLGSPSALAYILENGFYILFYIPNAVQTTQKQFLTSMFGPNVDSIAKIQPELGLPKLSTNESQFVNNIIEEIEVQRRRAMKVFIIRQGVDKLESIFRTFLYEDKKPSYGAVATDSSKLECPSYVDLLCHLHKEIRAQLN